MIFSQFSGRKLSFENLIRRFPFGILSSNVTPIWNAMQFINFLKRSLDK